MMTRPVLHQVVFKLLFPRVEVACLAIDGVCVCWGFFSYPFWNECTMSSTYKSKFFGVHDTKSVGVSS